MNDIEAMMAAGIIKVLYFCDDGCPKSKECDQRFSPCCNNFLGYRKTLEEKEENNHKE